MYKLGVFTHVEKHAGKRNGTDVYTRFLQIVLESVSYKHPGL